MHIYAYKGVYESNIDNENAICVYVCIMYGVPILPMSILYP